jgi:hypothetical protein
MIEDGQEVGIIPASFLSGLFSLAMQAIFHYDKE